MVFNHETDTQWQPPPPSEEFMAEVRGEIVDELNYQLSYNVKLALPADMFGQEIIVWALRQVADDVEEGIGV